MFAQPPANSVETVSHERTRRACPGCKARIDLGEYGLLTRPTLVVCNSCGRPTPLSELVRD